MTLDELIEICTLWANDGLRSEHTWYEIVEEAVSLILDLALKLAKEFEVAESIVLRWANDTADPHPRIQVQIIEYIKKLAMEAK
jgi:hypothetical protein